MAENQPRTKHRVNKQLSSYAARLREGIERPEFPDDAQFGVLALELFALQYENNPAYRKICEARRLTPATVADWTQIPAVPTGAFKEMELSCIPASERTAVFYSSGTTEQKPSRHFHCAGSLALYEASLWQWFQRHLHTGNDFVSLTPEAAAAPRSSLVHMFDAVRQRTGRVKFFGQLAADGTWEINFNALAGRLQAACDSGKAVTILGTAFSFVHLLDFLAEKNLQFHLPANSQVMETGGYKNRSRIMPKAELHSLFVRQLGVAPGRIICEYGMSELSSQAYDHGAARRSFHFPPWARVQIISPETGREVADGETGLIRILDLANAFSVAAIQTEDLGTRRGDGFELIGRAQLAEPRGCSLMTA